MLRRSCQLPSRFRPSFCGLLHFQFLKDDVAHSFCSSLVAALIAALLLASCIIKSARSRASAASINRSAMAMPGGGPKGVGSRIPLGSLGLTVPSAAKGERFCGARPSRTMPLTASSPTASIITRIACGGIAILLMASSVVVGPGVPSNLGGSGGLALRSSSSTRALSASSSFSLIFFSFMASQIAEHCPDLVKLGGGHTHLGREFGVVLFHRLELAPHHIELGAEGGELSLGVRDGLIEPLQFGGTRSQALQRTLEIAQGAQRVVGLGGQSSGQQPE